MTEAEWLTCTDVRPMLGLLRGKASDRKQRLFAVECCRWIEPLLRERECQRAVEGAEQFADGRLSGEELHARWLATLPRHRPRKVAFFVWQASHAVVCRDACLAAHDVWMYVGLACRNTALDRGPHQEAALLREIHGPLPFRPVRLDPGWRSSIVVNLARAIYAERTFNGLPVLADALEDAGCTDTDILTHCRSGGEHVRGCWVVDLLLGKE